MNLLMSLLILVAKDVIVGMQIRLKDRHIKISWWRLLVPIVFIIEVILPLAVEASEQEADQETNQGQFHLQTIF